jgi:hypothetical protein
VTNERRFTDADLSHVPNVGPWFAEFIEQRTTAAAAHVAGCHDDRCQFCHGGDAVPLGLVEHVSRQEFPDLSITAPADELDDEPDRDTADELEGADELARETWHPEA